MASDLPYWLGLVRFRPFGAIRLARLAAAFPSMREAFEASVDELIAAGIDPKTAERFAFERASIDPAKELAIIENAGIRAITIRDLDYPEHLSQIHDPPAVLFVRGTLPKNGTPHLAVVGSRHPTPYGLRATQELVEPAARAGIAIVSGLALGIDAAAHEAALAGGGTTLAVLGASVEDAFMYPSTHQALASRMLANKGALVAEFPTGTHPLPQNFPFRNRIIAGFGKATLVVEGAIKSGSLITAKAALESGRDVLAVPGPIHSKLSEGPNNLIKMGATPVTCPEDILRYFGLAEAAEAEGVRRQASGEVAYKPMNADEAAVYDALGHEPLHADEITRASGLPSPAVSSTLTMLEMKGVVRHVGGLHYIKL